MSCRIDDKKLLSRLQVGITEGMLQIWLNTRHDSLSACFMLKKDCRSEELENCTINTRRLRVKENLFHAGSSLESHGTLRAPCWWELTSCWLHGYTIDDSHILQVPVYIKVIVCRFYDEIIHIWKFQFKLLSAKRFHVRITDCLQDPCRERLHIGVISVIQLWKVESPKTEFFNVELPNFKLPNVKSDWTSNQQTLKQQLLN